MKSLNLAIQNLGIILFSSLIYTLKKGYSLRRISRELGCNKSVVRRKLSEAGIEIIQQRIDADRALIKKVQRLREQGLSYQRVTDLFNLWKFGTKSRKGIWHAKTVRELILF